MILSVFYFAIDLLLIFLGATWLVKGSSVLAIKAGISPLLSGLTIVAFGSSFPVLFVSVTSAFAGQSNMAIGSILGSNMFNICIILGISAIIAKLKIKLSLFKILIPAFSITTILFILLFADRYISRVEGSILLAGLLLYVIILIRLIKREKSTGINEEYTEFVYPGSSGWHWSVVKVSSGMVMLAAGSVLMVQEAQLIAVALGTGETIFAFIFMAAGSSLPILLTTIIATRNQQYDMAFGNIVSSGIFNILGVIGISAIISPLSALAFSNIDMVVMLGITLMLLPFHRSTYSLKRDDGIFMIALYLIYLYYLWPK